MSKNHLARRPGPVGRPSRWFSYGVSRGSYYSKTEENPIEIFIIEINKGRAIAKLEPLPFQAPSLNCSATEWCIFIGNMETFFLKDLNNGLKKDMKKFIDIHVEKWIEYYPHIKNM